jgi:outer membrane protein TolC
MPLGRPGAIVLALACAAPPSSAAELTFAKARERVLARNEAALAARHEETQRGEEAAAARALRWPRLEATARFTRLDQALVMDLEPVRQVILQLHPTVPSSRIPPFVQAIQDDDYWKADLRLTAPLYTGGRIDAAGHAAAAQQADSREQRRAVEGALGSELVRRYFGLRLAASARDVRAQVLAGLDGHLRDARRLEEEGLASRAERLHAEVARAEADRQLRRAEHDLDLARTVLKATLATDESVEPSTPLFVLHDLDPLADVTARALASSPALGRLAAQADLARQATRAERARQRPEVFAYAQHELHQADLTLLDPTWAVGVGARLTVFDFGEARHRVAAAREREERVALVAQKARRDLATLVEKNHIEAQKAREQFAALQASRALAEENLRVRTRGFEEGVATSLEVVDARLALARVELERLASAWEFVAALGDLLETCGESGRFEEQRARPRTEVQ